MKVIYRIKSITHSGRRGLRGEPVNDDKYDGLIGCRVLADITKIKQFESTHFDLLDYHRLYQWWNTSEVLALSAGGGKVQIETANTIYELEEWHEDKKGGD